MGDPYFRADVIDHLMGISFEYIMRRTVAAASIAQKKK